MQFGLLCMVFFFTGCISPLANGQTNESQTESVKKKMKIEIWSDKVCPFCYIGKRKFEEALKNFPQSADVEIVWRSYQLQPDLVTMPGKSVIAHLAESKGWTLDYSRQMHDYVVNMAKEVGLNYDFEKAVVANSFRAHALSHYAQTLGKGDAMEERLFQAYFINGENIGDLETLVKIAIEVGLSGDLVREVLLSGHFEKGVREDIQAAEEVGVTGVPFFVFDGKYAVSGAQSPAVFLQTLEKTYSEMR
jgi:predicted DsbA family dithiol-disulfide isomerase